MSICHDKCYVDYTKYTYTYNNWWSIQRTELLKQQIILSIHIYIYTYYDNAIYNQIIHCHWINDDYNYDYADSIISSFYPSDEIL